MQVVLDERGAKEGCSALDSRHCLVVARTDAVSVYTRDARGPVFVFPGTYQVAPLAYFAIIRTQSQSGTVSTRLLSEKCIISRADVYFLPCTGLC